MITRYATLLFLMLVLSLETRGQSGDSVRVPVPADSGGVVAPARDTLTAAQKAQAGFEERLKQFQKEKEKPRPRLSYYDSALAYFVSPRQNWGEQVGRSFYHDAGDYFRSDPSFFVLDYLVTPMRKTVQPFGLSGDRLNLMIGPNQYKPFEHIVQPDGMADLNDLPTALDHDVYILPGAVGQLLGAEQSVATLVTRPQKSQNFSPRTAIQHDRGFFSYNFTRGRYSRNFSNGRAIDMSIEYRNTDGTIFGTGDDGYNYFADVYSPIKPNMGVRAVGQLYNRSGALAVGFAGGGIVIPRDRFDRNLRLSVERHNSDQTRRSELGYRHVRQGSNLGGAYLAWYNMTGHGVFAAHEWIRGGTVFQARLGGDYSRYNNGTGQFSRVSGETSLSLARLNKGTRLALTAGTGWVEGYRLLPKVAFVLFRETEKLFLTLSVGYSERPPSLHELHLRFQRAPIYGAETADYANRGNPNLVSEKQLVGNITLELGPKDNCLGLSVTGGRIFHGIDWQNQQQSDSAGGYTLFSPANDNIKFANIAAGPRIRLREFLNLIAGGAYHYIDYARSGKRPYSPEYQLFSGLELHLFWAQTLVHLFAYGEVAWVGPYDGYKEQNLGKELVVNAKLSFSLKSFRFHYVYQNLLGRAYEPREYIVNFSRCNYWGITWNFFD